MARKKLLECSFLIPLRRDPNLSDGQPHEPSTWNWLHNALFRFGGATRALELYEGWYEDRDTHERVTDQSRRYIVAVPRSKVTPLRSLLREACAQFAQKCIYLSVAGQVELVEGHADEND